MNDRDSVFRFYSFGIVLEDKVRNSDYIKVLAKEELSIGDGVVREFKTDGPGKVKYTEKSDTKLLKDQTFKYEVKLPDRQNVDRTHNVEGDMFLNAKWIPLGQSNRITAPDMIKGETVMIFRVSDTDEYYWTPLMREPSIRRQETVLYAFGNIPKGLKAWDKETSYWMEVSTHDKYMHLHTSKNDGEPFMYDIKLDTAKGVLTVTDNAGNTMVLDSPSSKLTITTNNDVEVNTQNAVVNASAKVDVNTETATINASTTTVNSSTTTINASATTINSPAIALNGNVAIKGSLATGGGNVSMAAGNVSMSASSLAINSGNIALSGGSITANGEDLTTDRT